MSTPKLLAKLHRLGHDSFRYDGPPIIDGDLDRAGRGRIVIARAQVKGKRLGREPIQFALRAHLRRRGASLGVNHVDLGNAEEDVPKLGLPSAFEVGSLEAAQDWAIFPRKRGM